MRRINGKKVMNEQETRKKLLIQARAYGYEGELKAIFNKYDSLLKSCTNQQEYLAISQMALVEINNLLGGYDDFQVAGQIIKGKNNKG